jgi:thiamine kinase-like enzyme
MHILELQNYLGLLQNQGWLPIELEVGLLQAMETQQMTHPAYKLQTAVMSIEPHSVLNLHSTSVSQPEASLDSERFSCLASCSAIWIKCAADQNPWGASQITADQVVDRLLAQPFMRPFLIDPLYQDNWVRIEPFIETIDSPLNSNEASVHYDALGQAARVLSRLHQLSSLELGVSHRSLLQYLKEGLSQVREIAPALNIHNQLLAAIETYIEQLPNMPWFDDAPKALCHFDPTPGNWLWPIEADDPKLIDWEYAALSNPWVDLATFVDGFQLDQTQALYFISCYWEYQNAKVEESSTQKRVGSGRRNKIITYQAEASLETLGAWVQLVRTISQLWSWLEQYHRSSHDP